MMIAEVGMRRLREATRRDDPRYAEPVIPTSDGLMEYRCPKCDRLLFKAALVSRSVVETVCHNAFCRKHRRKITFSIA